MGQIATALPIHQAIRAVLKAIAPGNPADFSIPYLGVYDGEVPTSPPLDRDGRVRAYCVLNAGTGDPAAATMCGSAGAVAYRFGVTYVGGDPDRCLWVRDRVCTALIGLALTVVGHDSTGVIRAASRATAAVQRTDAANTPRHVAAQLFNVLSA